VKGFSERNPVTIAVTGLVALVLIAVGAFYSKELPLIGGGRTYAADFTDAGGLSSGNDVRIAGVKVGSVQSIKLDGDHVRVTMRVKSAWIGDQSTASIGIKTLLGAEYVAIDPLGNSRLRASQTIPTSRTTTPLDVNEALSGLSDTAGKIDTSQLATSFETLSAAFQDTPASVRSALTGLSALSETISSRDAQISKLAANAQQLTSTVASSNQQFAALINDGAALLQALQARSSAITQLLTGTRTLAQQLAGLVQDNDKTLGPALDQLSKVTDILTANQGNLKQALSLIGPYYTLVNNAFGNGHWVDVYICGLFDATGTPILQPDVQRNCAPKAG
jgi:phospholipid/cholesterol/gamma-HCH transport system substrate-binding protein